MEPDHPAATGRRPGPTPVQVMAVGLILAAAAAAVWSLRDRPQGQADEVELLAGTMLRPADLAVMEAVFDRADLTGYRVDGGRLFVSRGRQSGYLRALVDAGALPPEFGGSLRRAVENDSPWRSQASQAERLRIATQEELALVIRTMPGIEQAAVLYDLEEDGGLFREGREAIQTASVSVRTEPDATLDPHRVQAIRVLVASSIAGLRADRVAVTDLRSGRVYDGPLVSDADLVASDPERARAVAYERHVTAKIRQALSFIPGVVVEVNASPGEEATPVRAARGEPPRAAANTPAAIAVSAGHRSPTADSGRTVQVSIAIPEGGFGEVHSQPETAADPPADPATAELNRLKQLVTGLVPISPPWSRARVTITRYPGSVAAAVLPVEPLQPDAAAVDSGSDEPVASPDTAAAAGPFAAMVAGLPPLPERSLMLGASLGLAMLGGLAMLFGGSRHRGELPAAGDRRDAIDWSTLRRSGALDAPGEAA